MKYFLSVRDEQLGPFSEEMIVKIIKSKKIGANDYIWLDDDKKWIKIKDHPSFAMFFAPVSKPDEGKFLMRVSGKVVGPLTIDELKENVINGEVKSGDYIWDINSEVWIKAFEIGELKDVFKVIEREREHYISINGERMGPYSVDKIKSMIEGNLVDEGAYFFDGDDWIEISSIPEFMGSFPEVELPEPPPIPDMPKDLQDDVVEDIPPPISGESELIEDLDFGDDIIEERKEKVEERVEKKSRWLDDVVVHKVDLTGMKSDDAFAVPTSLIDDKTLNYSLDLYNKVTRVKRFLAGFIDSFIIIIFFLIVLIGLRVFNINPLIEGPEQYTAQVMLISVFGGLSLFYLLFRDGFTKSGSFGKKFSSIILITTKNRRPCGIFRSFLRNITFFIPVINLFEILIILFSKSGRRLGDRLAGTEMIEIPLEHKPF